MDGGGFIKEGGMWQLFYLVVSLWSAVLKIDFHKQNVVNSYIEKKWIVQNCFCIRQNALQLQFFVFCVQFLPKLILLCILRDSIKGSKCYYLSMQKTKPRLALNSGLCAYVKKN